jgi:predicted DNA-binding transcriptional regulator AlpA
MSNGASEMEGCKMIPGPMRRWLEGQAASGILRVTLADAFEVLKDDEESIVERLDLVSTKEAAALLGVERPRIARMMRMKQLPDPITTLGVGPIWLREQIEDARPYVEERRRQRRTEEPVAS